MYKVKISIYRTILIIGFILVWELLSRFNLINTFLFSSPSNIIYTIYTLFMDNTIWLHLYTTFIEILISFILGMLIAFILSIINYEFKTIRDIFEPVLTMLNSMPKVALGPIIIIWFGANISSIIVMALLINVIISTITITNGFINTDINKIKLFDTYKASKLDKLLYLVIPSNIGTIKSCLKINISLTFIGVIMGEFLVSKRGIGYLIQYGVQVFNLDLVMAGLVILIIMSYLIYKILE